MNPGALQAQAAQSSRQGQSMLHGDLANQAQYKGQYAGYQRQAQAANQNLQNYTKYMQGAGSATNLYNQGLQNSYQAQGFNPQALATATQNLTRNQNVLNQVDQASQSSTGGYGLSASQLGNYYASQEQPLQTAIQSQNNAVGNLQQLYQNALQNAAQYSGVGVQGEQATSGALNQVYQNAASQRDSAAQQMQFYGQLAQQQGGMNAQMYQGYQNAYNAYVQAQAAMEQAGAAATSAQASMIGAQAQAGLYGAQTKEIQQALNAARTPARTSAVAPRSTVSGLFGNLGLQGSNPSLQGGR